MDWNKHETIYHLSPMQVKQKIDEVNRERKVIPVLKKDLEPNALYTIEFWFHFRANLYIAIIYKDLDITYQ